MTGYSVPYQVLIIGGGAAGCMAADSAATYIKSALASGEEDAAEAKVAIVEASDALCKKILVTGNGRCNLSNGLQEPSCYYSDTDAEPIAWMSAFDAAKIRQYFTEGGILLHERGGYYYPRTDQAAVVAAFLEERVRQQNIDIILEHRVQKLAYDNAEKLFVVDDIYKARAVVIATGGLAAPSLSCLGDGYAMAASYNVDIVTPIPALTYLVTNDTDLKTAAGVRAAASITLLSDGKAVRSEQGELQFTERGISGIPTFQLSRLAGRLLEKKAEVSVCIDFLPELEDDAWQTEKARRLQLVREDIASEDYRNHKMLASLFTGLVHPKLGAWILQREGFIPEKKIYKLTDACSVCEKLLDDVRSFTCKITGTGDFTTAQTTAGGISLTEVDRDTMAIRKVPGLFAAGEVLDLDGICGGYNLTIAFSTGHKAGIGAASF